MIDILKRYEDGASPFIPMKANQKTAYRCQAQKVKVHQSTELITFACWQHVGIRRSTQQPFKALPPAGRAPSPARQLAGEVGAQCNPDSKRRCHGVCVQCWLNHAGILRHTIDSDLLEKHF